MQVGIRARTIAAREARKTEKTDDLVILARKDGIELAGWPIGAALFAELEQAVANTDSQQATIEQSDIGGAGLWLRAEAGEDPEQADMLAAIIAMGTLEP